MSSLPVSRVPARTITRDRAARVHAPRLHVGRARRPLRGGAPLCLVLVFACGLAVATPARAGVKSEAVEAAARTVMKKFDREVVRELGEGGGAMVARRMQTMAAKYGERNAIDAATRVGPRVFRVVDDAGEEGGAAAVRLLARKGDEALWVATRPKSLSLYARHGDEAAEAMIKHKEIAEGLIAGHGAPAARALKAVDGQNARRLAMMGNAGELKAIGRTGELLETVGRHGDGAMNWVWRHKGALATGTVLAAFLSDPQPFIDGTVEVARVGGETILRPAIAGVADGVATRTNWTLVISAIAALLAALVGLRMWLRRRVATTV